MGMSFRWHHLGEVKLEHSGRECVIVPHPARGTERSPLFGVISFLHGEVPGIAIAHGESDYDWLPMLGSDEIGIQIPTTEEDPIV